MSLLARLSVWAAISAAILGAVAQRTNLPDVPPGVFNTSARIEIQTTIEAAWNTLNDFANYADWNPFVRYAVVLSPANLTLPEQRPIENARLFMRVQIPPLPLPVNRSTPDNPLNTQVTYENITHVEPELRRLAWDYQPPLLLQAERWQALSDLGNGRVLYESQEVYHGALATFLRDSLGEGLQESFEGQAKGLKLHLERSL